MRFVWFLRKYFIRVWKIFFTTSSFHFPEKMLDLTEIPKLDLASSYEISTQKISVSDHIGGFQYTVDKHDSFVIDMDSFSYGGLNKGINQNPVPIQVNKYLAYSDGMRVIESGKLSVQSTASYVLPHAELDQPNG
ncbi:hypothetical protein ERO13_A05G327000v2 [Gossypium hirsutum]|uniref:Uncharacterized protein isoform X2 n=1 Tax=Gossypium hirsutum TaxID=3635 RepID=A0A1U8PKC3_GOSHI|nr:uncharacterized protein LOC107959972 isoform X2 [Gossypium hirsutum]KAG4202145.1 hypothetical protein ERO13_A05G327000v2 [Gossypium hirsutum]KAG4202146.1 hypothetical protein ERO13_A05G327000v2 [Gossypium hirsutum]